MMQSFLLDGLLVLVIILLVPIGVHRGGLREGCTAAGLLLGMHLVNLWAASWGGWLADTTGIVPDVAAFTIAVAVLLLTTGLVGYGATAAFASAPGAGGRIYGGILALLIGAVFLGSIISYVDRYLFEGETPDLIESGYVSRALSVGIEWILLLAALAILLMTLFGMVVRERDAEDFVMPISRAPVAAPSARVPEDIVVKETEKIEPQPDAESGVADELTRTAPVKIREVRHWEAPQSPITGPTWNQTWPDQPEGDRRTRRDGPGQRRIRRQSPRPGPATDGGEDGTDADALRNWLKDDTANEET